MTKFNEWLNEGKKELTNSEKKIVQDNTIEDSGVIYPTSWHSKSKTLYVDNININKGVGFYAERVYILKHNNKVVLKGKDYEKIVQKYSELLLSELKKEK